MTEPGTSVPAEQALEQDLRAKLNDQTARIRWRELQRHYARGVVVRVDAGLDLVEVAFKTVTDDLNAVQAWRADGRVRNADDQDALAWLERDAVLWAVVAAPWVLVQEQQCTITEAPRR